MPENNHIPAPYQVSVDVGGRALTLETGKIAKQANGAIVARYGDTVILNTACMATKANDKDFLPLTVDYRENTYSAGKIPGGFFKREGRPSSRSLERRLPRTVATCHFPLQSQRFAWDW
jgi:polyribonucleotide nucleotidyltransferase